MSKREREPVLAFAPATIEALEPLVATMLAEVDVRIAIEEEIVTLSRSAECETVVDVDEADEQ